MDAEHSSLKEGYQQRGRTSVTGCLEPPPTAGAAPCALVPCPLATPGGVVPSAHPEKPRSKLVVCAGMQSARARGAWCLHLDFKGWDAWQDPNPGELRGPRQRTVVASLSELRQRCRRPREHYRAVEFHEL